MKISATTLARLQRTLGVILVSAGASLAQNPDQPAAPQPAAPAIAPIDPPKAPVAPATVNPPPAAGTNVPAPIEPPLQVPGAIPQTAIPAPGQPATMEIANSRVMEFQGDDVALVLRTLARQAKKNVVVSPAVTGQITLRVEDKTPVEVMNIICQSNGLIIDELNGVMYVKTAAEKQKEPTEAYQFTFSYAMADKVAPLLTTQLTSGVAPQFDVRTNTIFFREGKSNSDKIMKFLESVDSPTKQVMIEARLVEVTANPKQSYGINWGGVVGSSSAAKQFTYGGSTPGSAKYDTATNSIVPDKLPGFQTDATTGKVQTQDFLRGANTLGQVGSLLSGQFAILSVPQMSATLRLLNEDSDAEFIANPRVVAGNNQKATIKITRNQPVPQLTFNEQTAQAVFGGFQDKEFGNMLTVTPSINKDSYVSMMVQPEISNKVGDATFIFGGATVASPIIDKRTFDSNVIVRSGDTLAIGGLLQDELTKGRTKIPVAGDIPLFGYLFQEKLSVRTKRNLLVFVTPTIIRQGYGTGLENQITGVANSGNEFADPTGWRNNAKGAFRIVPTSDRQIAADYPAPGSGSSGYRKASVTPRK
jgi:type IV pilus assembly protein PilQ